jgi:hypothetical protein
LDPRKQATVKCLIMVFFFGTREKN